MARTMVLKLTNIEQANAEGVVLKDDNKWTSPPSGWLPVQAGVYDQLPDGIHLHNSNKTLRVAILKGLSFLSSAKGNIGDAQYPSLGAVGKWTVVDIVDV